MKRFRIWDVLLGGALVAAAVHIVILVRQRAVLMDAIDGTTRDRPDLTKGDERVSRLGEERADSEKLTLDCERLQVERDSLASEVARLRSELSQAQQEQSALKLRLTTLTAADSANETEGRRIDSLQAELLASNDHLEKAYKDIAEMEAQLVSVSRLKND